MADEVEARVRALVAKQAGADLHAITRSTRFEDVKIDSLGIYEVAMGLEAEFHITFEDNELRTANTIADVVDAINRKRKAA